MLLVPVCRALVLLPLLGALSGCVWSSDAVWVKVHNHTDVTIQARDATCWGGDVADEIPIGPDRAELIAVGVFWYDADVEIEAAGEWRVFDLDISPFDYHETLHVYPADFAPFGNG